MKPAGILLAVVLLATVGVTGAVAECQIADAKLQHRSSQATDGLGELLKRLQGAAVGAVATMFVGFYWGGWSLGSTADKMAKERSELAVVSAMAPVCADKFRALPDAEAKQVALSKIDSWKRRDEFPQEFVTLPGESYPSSALVDACSALLLAPKSAALK